MVSKQEKAQDVTLMSRKLTTILFRKTARHANRIGMTSKKYR